MEIFLHCFLFVCFVVYSASDLTPKDSRESFEQQNWFPSPVICNTITFFESLKNNLLEACKVWNQGLKSKLLVWRWCLRLMTHDKSTTEKLLCINNLMSCTSLYSSLSWDYMNLFHDLRIKLSDLLHFTIEWLLWLCNFFFFW